MVLDLSLLASVRVFADDFMSRHAKLHFFVENAGSTKPVDGGALAPWVTEEGFENLYVSNYLSHFLLLQLLLPTIKESAPARISTTSSVVHWAADSNLSALLPTGSAATTSIEHYGLGAAFGQYGNTKFLQVAMCFELQRQLLAAGVSGVTVAPVSPGAVATAVGSTTRGVDAEASVLQPPREGAQTTLHALLDPAVEGTRGFFYQPYWTPLHRSVPRWPMLTVALPWELLLQKRNWGLHRWAPHPDAHRRDFGELLWSESMKAVGLAKL
jgi:NAD(P)-dependent dehydrogenase (short-subunit alcohol dehydrogenase family)